MSDPETTEPTDEDVQAEDATDKDGSTDEDTPGPDDEDTEGHKRYNIDITIKHDIQPLN